MNIVLTGFMGTGKTAVGKGLAEKLTYGYVDVDELIEKEEGCRIFEIFAKYGEPRFRDIETRMIKKISGNDKCVIATGGGAVLRKENMRAFAVNGFIVNLTASPGVIYERTKSSTERPLLNKPEPMKEIISLLEYRKPFYKENNLEINTDNLNVEEVVKLIIEKFNAKHGKS